MKRLSDDRPQVEALVRGMPVNATTINTSIRVAREAEDRMVEKVMEDIENNLKKYFVSNTEGRIATTKEWQELKSERG